MGTESAGSFVDASAVSIQQKNPTEASLTLLKKYHIYYVVLHLQYYSTTIAHSLRAQMESNPDLRRVAEFGYDSVWQVI